MEKLKIINKNLTFSEALGALKDYKLIKCPEWQGYWFLEAGMIHVKKHNGVVTNTPWLEATVLREDWQIVERDMSELIEMMYNQPMQIIKDGTIVQDNSNAFQEWLKSQSIDFECCGHQTKILGKMDMFDIGVRWTIHRSHNDPNFIQKIK